MAGRRFRGLEKDGCKRMKRQSKGSRDLEAYRRGGQDPPRAVSLFKKNLMHNFLTILWIKLLTYWGKVLLEKLIGFQLFKKFPAFYGTIKFITAFTISPHMSLSWTRLDPFHTPTSHFLKINLNTGWFKMIVGVWPPRSPDATPCHFFLWGYVKDQVYVPPLPAKVTRNWRYESEPPLKPSPLTCYKQFETNSIIVLMFVESQRVHI
jgi:hypothetical protein